MINAAKNVHTEKSTKDRTRTVRDGLPMIELGLEVSGFLFVCMFPIPFARMVTFSVSCEGAARLCFPDHAGIFIIFFCVKNMLF